MNMFFGMQTSNFTWLSGTVVNFIVESQTMFLRVGFQGQEGSTVGALSQKKKI